MEEKLKYFLLKVQDVLSCLEHKNGFVRKGLEGANNDPNFHHLLDANLTKEDKNCFQSLLCDVEQTILKPWSDSQDEFIVLSCHENDAFDTVNLLSVLSALAHKNGDTACVEEVQSTAVQYQQDVGAGFLMNNLGVMLSENVLYKKSKECFDIAKKCFECQQDHLRDAIVTLNLAVLHRALGDYQRAQDLCDEAASLCHDISMRTTKEACLPAKLLRRVADMLEEFGNRMFYNILRIGVHYDISGASKSAVIDLTKQLMKFQLQEEVGENIPVEEVEDFISHLFSLLDKTDCKLMNAEFIKTVIISAKFYSSAGHLKEACSLLKKLKKTFLLVHGGRCSLYGSLLYQISCFLHSFGKFDEAKRELEQAEEILIHQFGRRHHAVAMCKNLLGSCVLLEGNTPVALKHLNEAHVLFKNLNPNHPEVGEILLKLAILYVEEGNFQYAQRVMQEAERIFILTCGEGSRKTAGPYFQLGMILQKVDKFRISAADKIKKAIEILLNLGLNLDHSDVKVCNTVLGVLQHSLGMAEEAEKCFIDLQTAETVDMFLDKNMEVDPPSSECLLSEDNGHPPSETSTGMNNKHLSKNSSMDSYKDSGLSVKLPKEPLPDGCHMSSYEEGLTAGECCPGPETRGTKQLEDSHQLQTSFTDVNVEERLCLAIDHKGGVQGICTNDGELLPMKQPEGLHGNQNQQQDVSVEFPLSIPGPSSGASSEKIDAGTLTDDCFRPLLANLEDELSAFKKKCLELQQQINQLEEQLKQSEQEKQNLQADLGKYQFFEDKEKRHGRLLGWAAPMQYPAALGKYQLLDGKERHRERLLGGAAAVQDPGFSLRARLLEISNSLSAEEVKQIKFLAKSKVNGFRLARFTEAFELFEELETSGEFPCDYIGKLLAGIQRYDLAEELGMHVSLLETERGSNHPPEQSMPERKPELPDHASNSAKCHTLFDCAHCGKIIGLTPPLD